MAWRRGRSANTPFGVAALWYKEVPPRTSVHPIRGDRDVRGSRCGPGQTTPARAAAPPGLAGGSASARFKQPGQAGRIDRPQVALRVRAHRDRALGLLALADHEHEWDLGQLGVADLASDRLRPLVDADANTGLAEPLRERARVAEVRVGDRQHHGLGRRQPGRKAAAVVLDQDPGEALHRAEQCAVDHHRPVLGVVLALIGEAEALGHLEVELAGAELPRAPESVGDVEVDLRPVERPLARAELVLAPLALERLTQPGLGTLPLLVGADRLLRTCRKLDPDLVEAEARVELVDRLADRVNLVGNLLDRKST